MFWHSIRQRPAGIAAPRPAKLSLSAACGHGGGRGMVQGCGRQRTGAAAGAHGVRWRKELRALRSLADVMLGLEAMPANGTISEVSCDGQAV